MRVGYVQDSPVATNAREVHRNRAAVIQRRAAMERVLRPETRDAAVVLRVWRNESLIPRRTRSAPDGNNQLVGCQGKHCPT
jgi:hypothetical protein